VASSLKLIETNDVYREIKMTKYLSIPLVQAGVDLPTVKRISGHKTLAMVEKYAHQNGAHIQTAMDKLESRIQAVK
jgi:hypothetical protein